MLDSARDVAPRDTDPQIPSGASADPELAKALALIEKRLPQLPESSRQELRRHFGAAFARLSESPRADAPVRDRSSQPDARRARGR